MSALKIKPGVGTGHYDLVLGDEKVGAISKKVENYNLRRVITTTSWLLWWRGEKQGTYGFGTRKAAVAEALRLLSEESP